MNTMQSIQRGALLLAALVMSLMTAGAARAQHEHPSFRGKFTLITPVHWGKSVLEPGEYTVCVESMASVPNFALIQKEGSTFSIRVMSGVRDDYNGNSDALQLKIKNGELVVQALRLADLKTTLVYDSSSREQKVEEVRANVSIPVLVARK